MMSSLGKEMLMCLLKCSLHKPEKQQRIVAVGCIVSLLVTFYLFRLRLLLFVFKVSGNMESNDISTFEKTVIAGAETSMLDNLPKDTTTVLAYGFWYPKVGHHKSWVKTGYLNNSACPRCYVHTNIHAWGSSDVIFYNLWISPPPPQFCDMPLRRMHVLSLMEAPVRRPAMYYELFNGCFHYLSTYRLSEAVPSPYGLTVKLNHSKDYEFIKRKKSRLGVWMASHCATYSRRERFVQVMQSHVTIDVYGNCGNFSCPRDQPDGCWKSFEETYFFYFALENSLCDEYLTEKVWLALAHDIVPVVFGGANYSQILPPHSYINVFNFSSPQKLAEYLEQVVSNPGLYESYFHWKKFYQVEPKSSPGPSEDALCSACVTYEKLGRTTAHVDVINDVEDRWSADKQCRGGPWYVHKWWDLIWR